MKTPLGDYKGVEEWTAVGKSKEELHQAYQDCMLGHYRLFVAGAGVGLMVGITRKNYWPLVTGGFVGSMGDYFEAQGACKDRHDAWMACREREAEEEAQRRQQDLAFTYTDAELAAKGWKRHGEGELGYNDEELMKAWEKSQQEREAKERGAAHGKAS
ncbi:unnamed protein product [Chrysoparadoxa australica]